MCSRATILVALVITSSSLSGCASLRQSMRGQELSYRGAWYCKSGPCSAGEMVKSTTGTRDGTTMINSVKLDPKAGLAFTAAAAFDSLTATARDCKGHSAEIPAADIVAPAAHGIADGDARESWIVWVDPNSLSSLDPACRWTIDATGTWADGASFSLSAGIDHEN